jgi:hypothetical protein
VNDKEKIIDELLLGDVIEWTEVTTTLTRAGNRRIILTGIPDADRWFGKFGFYKTNKTTLRWFGVCHKNLGEAESGDAPRKGKATRKRKQLEVRVYYSKRNTVTLENYGYIHEGASASQGS